MFSESNMLVGYVCGHVEAGTTTWPCRHGFMPSVNKLAELPPSLAPRLLTREQAAEFCALTTRQFTRARREHDEFGEPIVPDPILIAGQELWHVEHLRQRLDVLAGWSETAINDNEAERRVRQWRK